MEQVPRLKLAIIGASGFVGRRLIDELMTSSDHNLLALSRNPIRRHRWENHSRFQWQAVDLHNLLSLERALDGVDVAIYLVHSMLPSARLNQGSFADFDLSLADNFGRAARRCGIKQIIYLGALVANPEHLSPHLASRIEVETTLAHYIPNLTCIRSGMIIGEGGSSFTILYRLVKRLPVMICPSWTKSFCQPILIDDVIRALVYCIAKPDCYGRIFDIGCTERINYLDLMRKTGDLLGRRPKYVVVPVFSPMLSRLWVSLIAQAPKSLVYPLIHSLKDHMVTSPERYLRLPNGEYQNIDATLRIVLDRFDKQKNQAVVKNPHAFQTLQNKGKCVRSIQRLYLPPGKNAKWVSEQYMKWLPQFFSGIFHVRMQDQMIRFRLKWLPLDLLLLKYSPERSQVDRQLFYICGGLLVGRSHYRGRLELRETLGGQAIIAAVHDYVPSLPWFIYRMSQAKVHIFVMRRFHAHLQNLAKAFG